MRSARVLNILIAAGVASALATTPALAAPIALPKTSSSSIADHFSGTQIEGTLIKTVVDYPAAVISAESLGTDSDSATSDSRSTARSNSTGASSQEDSHTHDTDYAVRVGDIDVPVENTDGALSDLASGSQVTLNVEVPAVALDDSASATSSGDDSAPLTREQAASITNQITEPLSVTNVSATSTPLQQTSANTGNHRVTVVIPQRTGAENRTLTEDAARTLLGKASDYWSSQTLGKVTGFKITTVKTYTTSLTKKQLCAISSKSDRERLWSEAAKKSGYKQAARTHLIVLTEPCSDSATQALGVAEIGSSLNTGGRVITNDGNLHTLVHEIGHNFSLGHANLRSIFDEYEEEYLGMFSPMSATADPSYGTIPALDVAYQLKLGVLGANQISRVTGTKTVKINSVTSNKSNRAVYFYDPTTGSRIFVEYRSGTNFDASALYLNTALAKELSDDYTHFRYGTGVRVYTLEEKDAYRYNDTGTFAHLVKGSVLQTTLRAGDGFTHETSKFKVSVKSLTNDTATVSLSVPKAKSSTKASNISSKFGASATVKTTVSSKVPAGGKVVATINGKSVGSAKVPTKSGSRAVKVKLSSKLAVGTHSVKLRYSGDSSVLPSAKTIKVTVKKSTPKVQITTANTYYKSSPKVKVSFKTAVAPSGRVTLKVDGKTVSTKTLRKGAATFKVSSKLPKGKHSLKVFYSGSKGYKATTGTESFTVTVKKGKISGLRSGTANVKLGATYKDTFKVNNAAKLQLKSGGKWKTVKTLGSGTHVLKHKATAKPKSVTYRVVISGSSTTKAAVSKSITLKTVSK